ncbi:MAG: hypothetical protein ACD_71C00155G0002 [uncultured bacterium (gcode 4)]|uniref:Uncharacterized protein n=1 Tax=uncultured bacterium (gcode 4) TaxID=1234023 RepID=K1Z4A2_9BACT|nr:MAG: hypothetical protein ACD_71C00155G0002 [uncultured bacterium (gcode 4)]HBB38161.1 hypothetical protein [Candidatus Magasanikbacteria bacterium]HCC13715.1 hypothetical protein [Candidatus Magasanikbacteria bacterium]HCM54066.1 hypothetical protein [Candidatus Magasanikbacteria bacterium]
MKKNVIIIDFLLLGIFTLIIVSKFIDLSFVKIIQLIFFSLIAIHIIQHRKIIYCSFKKLIMNSK